MVSLPLLGQGMLDSAWREYEYQNFGGAARLFSLIQRDRAATADERLQARIGTAMVVHYRIPGGDPQRAIPLYRAILDSLGDAHPLRANVRVIAATHQNLEERVKQGAFREDLYHRLNVIRLRLPALRERREDVPALARFFLQKSARELSVEAKRISEPALQRLMQFDFPGNVRQLENICHWLTVMAPGQRVEVADLPPEVREPSGAARVDEDGGWLAALDRELAQALSRGEPAVGDRLEHDFERALIRRALAHTGGHRMEAAKRLGWGRNTLTRKMRELGMESAAGADGDAD
jgi:two-component system nitrogen regulation response regulator GlnG